MKTHLLTHTDIKPYNCADCGKEFRRNCDLRRHTSTHTLGLSESQLNSDNNDSCCSLQDSLSGSNGGDSTKLNHPISLVRGCSPSSNNTTKISSNLSTPGKTTSSPMEITKIDDLIEGEEDDIDVVN